MKTRPITNLFEDKGLIVFKSEEKSIFDLKYGEIVHLFEKHGLILFRGFEIKPNEISIFTDMYTEKYARDAYFQLLVLFEMLHHPWSDLQE